MSRRDTKEQEVGGVDKGLEGVGGEEIKKWKCGISMPLITNERKVGVEIRMDCS